jgi:hypothetical protein
MEMKFSVVDIKIKIKIKVSPFIFSAFANSSKWIPPQALAKPALFKARKRSQMII